ncbi:Cacna1i [Symbiodinium pilosum]|uniref:Cacna1i protein n=1 Tax=Symbiodinium pilosum TaxID=2952 RepID=A0A812T8C2_SYMPI|nr:Cacna1i [Symbiodinium pilosum]
MSKSPESCKASIALRPTFFRTFTQVDNSLRHAASAVAASRARTRFASNQFGSDSVGDGKISCIVRVVDNVWFDFFFAALVLVNCVFIGILDAPLASFALLSVIVLKFSMQSHIRIPKQSASMWSSALDLHQYLLASLFALELVLRLCAYGFREFFFGPDGLWSLLDAFIVLSSVWDVVLDLIFLWEASGSDNPVSTLRALRILRLARIVKAVRLMRVFRFVRALRTLISSIFHTLRSLFWALVLMVLIVYVFGVLFSQAVNSHILDPESPPLTGFALEAASKHYYSLSGTMLSLFMCISGGTNWENVLVPLRSISEFWVFLFIFYVAFTYFAVLNVLTAVFCQTAIESAQNDQASMVQNILEEKEAHRDKLLDLFVEIGAEQETITFDMFQEKINDPDVREYFTSIGLDVWDAWSFFKLLDLDEGGAVEVDEFLMGCLRLRGQARAVDVGKIIYDQTWLIRNQSHFQGYVEVQLKQMKDLLSQLAGVRLQSVHLLSTLQPY